MVTVSYHISLAEEKLVKLVECMNDSQRLFFNLGISLFSWAEGALDVGCRLPQDVSGVGGMGSWL